MSSLPDMSNSAKINTTYLQGSHFTLSQEESWTPGTRLSTFKKDYIPYNVDDKPAAATPKEPAKIFNKDERFFNNNHSASETLAEYQLKPFAEKATYDTNKLRRTNFKMDSDDRQTEPYLSIQKTSYPPKQADHTKAQPKITATSSNIPQGMHFDSFYFSNIGFVLPFFFTVLHTHKHTHMCMCICIYIFFYFSLCF